MFGEERVRTSFLENVSSPSRDIVHSILGSIYEFTGYSLQEDDITLICIKKR
jgi:serine phosphatase RsbU (regulator of sigma subunit)